MTCAFCCVAVIAACHRGESKPINDPQIKEIRPALAKVSRLEITTTWFGLGSSASAGLELAQSRDGSYEGSWSERKSERAGDGPMKPSKAEPRRVNASSIDDLANALARPCLPQPTLAAFGVTTESLREHAKAAEESLKPYFAYKDAPPAVRSAFERDFVDPAKAQRALERLYRGEHTDDYPGADVTLLLADGTKWTATSMSQLEEMLPWEVTRPATAPCKSYDPAISRAAARFMPEGMLNRERLDGSSFYSTLASEAVFQIEEAGEVKR